MITNLRKWFRQLNCNHVGYLKNLKRYSTDYVTCPCERCGKLLDASYGLALPITWLPDPAPVHKPTLEEVIHEVENAEPIKCDEPLKEEK